MSIEDLVKLLSSLKLGEEFQLEFGDDGKLKCIEFKSFYINASGIHFYDADFTSKELMILATVASYDFSK